MRTCPTLDRPLANTQSAGTLSFACAGVGRSGSGKSTLGLAILRALPTNERSIYIDDQDVARVNLQSLRGHAVTLIPQGALLPRRQQVTEPVLNDVFSRPRPLLGHGPLQPLA